MWQLPKNLNRHPCQPIGSEAQRQGYSFATE
jgi:hypothetical protein